MARFGVLILDIGEYGNLESDRIKAASVVTIHQYSHSGSQPAVRGISMAKTRVVWAVIGRHKKSSVTKYTFGIFGDPFSDLIHNRSLNELKIRSK